MGAKHIPPLAINFVWNFADDSSVSPILDVIKNAFARNNDRPFSRGLNIPLFYYSSLNPNNIPNHYPSALATKNLIFVFTSVNTTGRIAWKQYIEALPVTSGFNIVPIAVSSEGLSHQGSLDGLNCVRAYNWPSENTDLQALVALAHEVYRYGCTNSPLSDNGKANSINLFLSHAKAGNTGKVYAEEIMRHIDETNMNRFFDSTEISPGFAFDREIEGSVKKSTIVAIETDAYSSRYWCQREILCAKENNRPILVVNCLSDYEDRIFPAASNVPCVHVHSNPEISQRDILRILSAAILETIRYEHSMQSLKFYKAIGWIDKDCELSARPPEVRQVISIVKNGIKTICYPEPPIYPEEADWHQYFEIEARTPLWRPSEDSDSFSDQRICISVSDVHGDGFCTNHLNPDHLVRLSQDLARHLLARASTLIYGGDLRRDGFTEFVLNEAAILKGRICGELPKVENHLAWPLYISDADIVSWRSRYSHVMETKEHQIPNDVATDLDSNFFLPPDSPENSYIWSRCLTEMREKSTNFSTARICAGGKRYGYKGKMPGVLEEVILAIESQKPLFLLGGFGGIVADICQLILTGDTPDALTEEWQVSHNSGYSELQNLARQNGYHCDYEKILATISKTDLSTLSKRSGLEEHEYQALMESSFIDECIHLITKGISTYAARS